MSSLRSTNGIPASPPRTGRCVVLAEAGGAVPALLAGLARRGLLASVVSDAPSVMVELARAPAAAVILTANPAEAAATELLDAVRTYYPHTGCWAFQQGQGDTPGRLVKVESPPTEPHSPAAPASESQASATPTPPTDVGGDDGAQPLISQEEMAMLLGQGAADDEQGWGG